MLATRNYLKFLFVVMLLVVLLLLYVGTVSSLTADRTMPAHYQAIRYHNELIGGKFKSLENLDVLIIGDSTASRSLLPLELRGLRAASIAMDAAGAVEAYYMLRKYYNANVPGRVSPRCVLLMTSYGAQRFHADIFFWPLIIGHGRLTYNEAMELYENSKRISAWPSTEFNRIEFNWRFVESHFSHRLQFGKLNEILFRPHLTLSQSQRQYLIVRRNHGAAPQRNIAAWLGHTFISRNQDYLTKTFSPEPILDFYFDRIAELTRENDSKLILLYGPLANAVRTPAAENWLKANHQHIGQRMNQHPHVLNFIETQWQIDADFFDASHLNARAAATYSQKISARLQECRNK